MYRYIVPGIPPSNNQYMGNSKSFNLYRRKKEEWHWLIKSAIKDKPKKPFENATVRIIYYFRDNHRRDPDNYSGKFILDPLVKEGILIDDSFDVITLRIEKGGVDKKNPHTVIEVIENHRGSVILSGYDNLIYDDYLKNWRKISINTTAEKGRPRTENIWIKE